MIALPEHLAKTRLLVERQLAVWPEHVDFLSRSFAERDDAALTVTEDTASQILVLANGELDDYCRGYQWMCGAILEEELYFRRFGHYRATSAADVSRVVYDDEGVMRGYMNGLLLSQVFWRNHVDVAAFYARYLESLPADYRHLEIGPGHGLLLARAAMDARCASASGWDISEGSLSSTRHCLDRLGVSRPVTLEHRNVYDVGDSPQVFDSIVVSELLEHLEDPAGALAGVRRLLSERGRAFIHVPCNSPAPDHLFLFSSPDHFFGMLDDAGFVIVERFVSPATGATLDRALRKKLTVSCAAMVCAR